MNTLHGVALLDRPHDAPDDSVPDSSASARAGALHEIINLADSSLLGTVRHQTAYLIETQDARLAPVKHEEHQHRPLVAEATDYISDWTSQIFCFYICHNNRIFGKNSANRTQSKLDLDC